MGVCRHSVVVIAVSVQRMGGGSKLEDWFVLFEAVLFVLAGRCRLGSWC